MLLNLKLNFNRYQSMNVCLNKFFSFLYCVFFHIAPDTIEADFTDSVSLILHQLQQESTRELRSSSMVISEEDEEEDDDDDDDGDESDNENAVQSIVDGKVSATSPLSIVSVLTPVELEKSIQTDLSFSSNDNISFTKVESTNKQKPTTASSTSINKQGISKKDENININKKKPINQPVKKSK